MRCSSVCFTVNASESTVVDKEDARASVPLPLPSCLLGEVLEGDLWLAVGNSTSSLGLKRNPDGGNPASFQAADLAGGHPQPTPVFHPLHGYQYVLCRYSVSEVSSRCSMKCLYGCRVATVKQLANQMMVWTSMRMIAS